MQKSDCIIGVEHVSKFFGDKAVLNDVNLSVRKGEFVTILGPSGCGKTTFLNLLTCLIEPTSGEILVDGEKADPRKHNLAFVFQEPTAYPWLTVKQHGTKSSNRACVCNEPRSAAYG